MQTLYLVKASQATTAIEGNTLSTEQIRERVEGRLDLPPSQEYLGQEVDNVIRACNATAGETFHGRTLRLDAKWIAECNRQVLAGLEPHLDEGVVAGEIPAHAVGVGRYRGAPREDCDLLLQRLCEWLEGERDLSLFAGPGADRIATTMLHAILAHLYIAWIHPFGDGNGRTARLIEFMLLARAGGAAHVGAAPQQSLQPHAHRVLSPTRPIEPRERGTGRSHRVRPLRPAGTRRRPEGTVRPHRRDSVVHHLEALRVRPVSTGTAVTGPQPAP